MSSIKEKVQAIPDVCRVCTESNVAMVNIFDCTKRNIADEIQFCTGILILENENDNLPRKICCVCVQQLQVAYKFKQNCLQAEERFQRLCDEIKVAIMFERDDEDETTETGESLFEPSVDNLPDVKKESKQENANKQKEVRIRICNYLCQKCNAKFPSSQEASAHFAQCDFSQYKQYHLKCNVCNKRYKHPSDLKKHKPSHTMKCAHCEYSTLHRSNLIKHLVVHTGEKNYQCKYCGQLFAHSGNLSSHIRRLHQRNDQHLQTQANWISLPKIKERLRLEKVGMRICNYVCKRCNTKFPSSQEASAHSAHCGKDEQHQLECNVCGKHYNHPSALYSHQRFHKPSQTMKCDHCEYSTLHRTDLIKHLTVHAGEKNHQCKYCGKLFTFSSNLFSHTRRIHERTEEMKISCKLCGKRCKDKHALYSHLRIHTNRKKFECEECGVWYLTRSCWKKHLKIKHNIVVPTLKGGRKTQQGLVVVNGERIKGNSEDPN